MYLWYRWFFCDTLILHTLQETNISHLGKRKLIFKHALSGGYVSSLEGVYTFIIYYRFSASIPPLGRSASPGCAGSDASASTRASSEVSQGYAWNVLKIWLNWGTWRFNEIYLDVIMTVNEHWMSVLFNIVDACQEPPDEEMAKVAAGADDRRQEIPNNKFDRSCFQVKYVMFYVVMFLAFERRSLKLEFSRWIPCRCQEIDDRDGLESRGATWKNTEGTCGVFVRMFGGTYPCASRSD